MWPLPFAPLFPVRLQPPLADAEQVRDAVIAKLFEDLGKQGLDANHPFSAYGGKELEPAERVGAPCIKLCVTGRAPCAAARGAAASDCCWFLLHGVGRAPCLWGMPPSPRPRCSCLLRVLLRGAGSSCCLVPAGMRAATCLLRNRLPRPCPATCPALPRPLSTQRFSVCMVPSLTAALPSTRAAPPRPALL